VNCGCSGNEEGLIISLTKIAKFELIKVPPRWALIRHTRLESHNPITVSTHVFILTTFICHLGTLTTVANTDINYGHITWSTGVQSPRLHKITPNTKVARHGTLDTCGTR
jgi:hypothetical protein